MGGALFADVAVAGPASSRGQQFFAISHQECLSRASGALRAAGYTLWGEPGNGPWGDRGPHTAVIFCEPTTGGRVVVDIVVATEGTRDGNVPGTERVALQQLMEGAATPPAGGGQACPSNATDLRGSGRSLTCWCPANDTRDGSVWGTDVYTDDSRICRAAVHAGAITSAGGQVTIRSLPGMQSYAGSERNGVGSSGYGTWGGSYRFE